MAYLGNQVAPLVQALEGKELKLDSDGDSSITADTDDQIDIKISGADDYKFTANNFTALDSSNIVFGTGSDAKIFHDGNNTKFQHTGTGGLYVGADTFGITNGATDTTHISIDSNGHVLMPNQPAFQARPSGTISNIATETVISMNNEIFDQGSDYNTSTYTFTAPVTGRYFFSVAVRIDSLDTASNWQRITLDTSNHSYANSIIDLGGLSGDPTHWNISYAVLADMDANDTASIKYWQSGGSTQADISASSYFSGYLAC